MTMILAGDIGGTKTLLRVAEKNSDGLIALPRNLILPT